MQKHPNLTCSESTSLQGQYKLKIGNIKYLNKLKIRPDNLIWKTFMEFENALKYLELKEVILSMLICLHFKYTYLESELLQGFRTFGASWYFHTSTVKSEIHVPGSELYTF